MTTSTVAALQCRYTPDMQTNIHKTIALIEEAAAQGAQIILPPELFQSEYFCTAQEECWFDQAYSVDKHPCIRELQPVAHKLKVVIPVSFFERDGPHTYNSIAILDHQGEVMGVYRKSHIPDGPGYMEKYYFRPGDTGFKTWQTPYGCIGVGICWDQWFPESARQMMLQGAELLFYPTAIGSEPYDESLDTSAMWRRAMQGHAVSNAVPVIAANRTGQEQANGTAQEYYGHSFIADQHGELVAAFGNEEEGALVHRFDLRELRNFRSSWGFFRDRRPELYTK